MKTIVMIRHGFKTEDGKHITKECREEIRRNGINGVFSNTVTRIHEGSACIITRETVTPFIEHVQNKGIHIKNPILRADPRFGSDELVAKMVTPAFKEARKSGKSNFTALKKTATPKNFARWSSEAYQALLDLFNQLEEDDVCLSATHSPIIEMILKEYTAQLWQVPSDFQIKELQGIKFQAVGSAIFSAKGVGLDLPDLY